VAFERAEYGLGTAHQIRFVKLTKIHIQCKDAEGDPMKGRPYEITLPRGQKVKAELDDQGWAKHDDIYPGECTFKLLPDGEVLTPVDQPEELEDQLYHLRLRFEDENGDPFIGKPFELDAGDTLIEGNTDDTGKLVADVPMTCTEGEITIWLDDDKSGESYTWPLRIADHAE
jgi:hypothetical protein